LRSAINVWIFVFVMIGVIMMLWYVSQPVVQHLVDETRTVVRDMNANTTGYEQGITSIELVNVVWAPIFILIMLVFGFLASSQREGVSYYKTY
jgi:hypothetical protein